MATRGRAPAQDPADQRRPLQPGVLRGAAPRHSAPRWHIINVYCGRSNLDFSEGREPAAVLLRLFGDLSAGPAHHYRMITETVVFTMLAERGLGPQLQAVFPGGEWQTLLKC